MSFRPKGEILKPFKISQSLHFFEMTFLIFSRSLGKIIAFTFFLLQITIYHQTDWIRWDKSDPTYQIQDTYLEREYDFTIESVSDVFVKPVMNTYLFFISDVDGANCPFHPSCSSFLMQSIKETNLLQGTFMFFDRFTRDINVFGRHEHYPKYSKNHFYDPVSLYTLDERKINYISANSFIDE